MVRKSLSLAIDNLSEHLENGQLLVAMGGEDLLNAATARIVELEALAYLGEHHFPDLTYKARLEELVPRLRAFEDDLAQAAGECRVPLPEPGTDMARLLTANKLMREALRRAERREMDALAELDELRAELECVKNGNTGLKK